MRPFVKPTEDQLILYTAINRELKKRTESTLTDEERTLITAWFVSNYDFSNAAIAHKSAGGWANLIISELGIT